MKKNLLPLLALLTFQIISFQEVSGQTKVAGVLIDADDNELLGFANVAVLQMADSVFVIGTTTDEKGFFEMQLMNFGQYYLRISYLGYGTQMLSFEIDSTMKNLDLGRVKISKAGQDLQEVVITANKPMYSYDGEKRVYNVSEDPSVQGGVATDALQNAPGVYVDMEGNITLRGVSGVEIWINDKPSRIKAEGLKSFLQQLPANTIDRIEVISNPSARYGAEGTGGIINIITTEKIKRNELLSFGLNGSTQISYTPWVSYVISKEKYSLNAYVSHSASENTNRSFSDGYVMFEGDTMYGLTNISESVWGYSWTYGHLSFTWEIDSLTNFDIWAGGAMSSNFNESFSSGTRTLSPGEIIQMENYSEGDGNGKNMNAGFSFERRFRKKDGHKISLDGYGGSYISDNYRMNERKYNGFTQKDFKYQENGQYNGVWLSSFLNYVNPLGKKRILEAGATLSQNSTDRTNPTDTFNYSTGLYEYVAAFTNIMDSRTLEGALYTTYADTLGFLKYKLGVRYEYGMWMMNSVALTERFDRSWGTFFPTLHLSTTTKNKMNFSLSYSRRVRYPDYELDPFVSRVNEESIHVGNLWLNPAFTDAYEVGFSKFFNSGASIMSTVYHRRTMKDITSKSEGVYDDILQRYTVYSTYINSGKNIFTGADVTITVLPLKNLRCMWYTNVYNQDFYADLGSYVVEKSNLTYSSMLNLMYNYKNFRFQLMGNYRAASESLIGSTEPQYWINATVNADFFKRKMSLRLGVMDVFNWREHSSTVSTPTYSSVSSSKQKSQFVSFGLTFRFGRTELERQQKQPDMSAPAPM